MVVGAFCGHFFVSVMMIVVLTLLTSSSPTTTQVHAFSVSRRMISMERRTTSAVILSMASKNKAEEDTTSSQPEDKSNTNLFRGPLIDEPTFFSSESVEEEEAKAMTGTVNERLLSELQQASDREKYGARSRMGKKMGLLTRRRRDGDDTVTDAERQAAIAAARNLNGVNPIVALVGSAFALAVAAGLWALTNVLAEYFALHPIAENQVYAVARVTAVMRNVVMGLVALATGFFGVTGMGIFLLGVRVAYGVVTGELDPTPLPTSSTLAEKEKVDMGSVWDLRTNKNQKRGRR